jgi:hypothetical protein
MLQRATASTVYARKGAPRVATCPSESDKAGPPFAVAISVPHPVSAPLTSRILLAPVTSRLCPVLRLSFRLRPRLALSSAHRHFSRLYLSSSRTSVSHSFLDSSQVQAIMHGDAAQCPPSQEDPSPAEPQPVAVAEGRVDLVDTQLFLQRKHISFAMSFLFFVLIGSLILAVRVHLRWLSPLVLQVTLIRSQRLFLS